MIPYYIVLMLIVLNGILLQYRYDIINAEQGETIRKSSTTYVFITTLSIILLIGLRSVDVGSDTLNYYNTYQNADLTLSSTISSYVSFMSLGLRNFLLTKNTIIFRYICSLFRRLGLSYNGFLVVVASMYVVPIAYLVKKDSNNIWISFLTFFLFSVSLALTGVRITLALGLTAISYVLLEKKKRIASIAISILAIMVHLSAIVYVLVFIVDVIPLPNKSQWIIVPIMILVPFIRNFITPKLMSLTYYESVDTIDGYWSLSLYSFLFTTTVLLLLNHEKDEERYCKMMILGTILCGLVNYGALENCHKYFTQYLCIVLPNIMVGVKSRNIRTIVKGFIILVFIYRFTRVFSTSSQIVPYLFYWQQY